MRRVVLFILVIVTVFILAWFFLIQAQHGTVRLRVATTTSLYATGLLEKLADEFQKRHSNVRIEFIPVGSGRALELAAKGDVCMVFVHAPSLEAEYIREGVLEYHHIFAYNYFVIVGPRDDPAGVRHATSAVDAFRRIYEAGEEGKAVFVSRGDMSGTNVRELVLWKLAGLNPQGKPWYIESGAGMGKTLLLAENKRAYTLSDIGTFLKYKLDGRIPDLELLYTNSTELINVYSVYLVRDCSGEERDAAIEFINFVVSDEGQEIIAKYGVDRYGKPLFYPAKGYEKKLEEAWEWLTKLTP